MKAAPEGNCGRTRCPRDRSFFWRRVMPAHRSTGLRRLDKKRSSPHPPAAASGPKRRLSHNGRTMVRFSGYAALVLLLGGPLLARGLTFWDEAAAFVAFVIGIAGAGACVLIAALLYFGYVRQADRDVAAFERGD